MWDTCGVIIHTPGEGPNEDYARVFPAFVAVCHKARAMNTSEELGVYFHLAL